MKILLLGEYSGLHNCLKDGLAEYGVNAVVASDGDSWKKFPSDINFNHPLLSPKSIAGKIYKSLKPFSLIPLLHDFDAVQLINPMVLTPQFYVNSLFIRSVLNKSKKIFLVAAGDDAYYYNILDKLRYNPIDAYRNIDLNGEPTPWDNEHLIRLNQRIVERADKIIPVAYDYWLGYSSLGNCSSVIPMPVNVDKYQYRENVVDGKIVFMHGLNRPGFKGSKYICDAFDRMRAQYSHVAEFYIADRLPVTEYEKMIDRANVIVDQALSYSFGMNALISLAKGKIVMSGAEPEILPIYTKSNIPVLNITPNVDQICAQIKAVIDNHKSIKFMGEASREFVTTYHSHKVVAKKFIDSWDI